jgi:hypothetical protein
MSDFELIPVYDRLTGRKLGKRPRSWVRRFEHIAETPASKRRSKKKAAPEEKASDTAPEEENS